MDCESRNNDGLRCWLHLGHDGRHEYVGDTHDDGLGCIRGVMFCIVTYGVLAFGMLLYTILAGS